MVDAGLARRVAGNTVPVSSGFVTNSTYRAVRVAATVVNVKAISAVVALEILGALEAADGAADAG